VENAMSDDENLNLTEFEEDAPPAQDDAPMESEDEAAPLLAEPRPPAQRPPQNASELEAVAEIPVEVAAVLGVTSMPVSGLLKLSVGDTVELSRKVGEAIDIQVNDRIVARGEVVAVDEKLGISMTEIIKKEKD